MSVFHIFISPTEFKYKDLMKKKPEKLFYTLKKQTDSFIIPPTYDDVIKKDVTICTDNKKLAMLHIFDPFFSFKFGDDSYGVIILGENHDLLKLEKETAYVYSIDSHEFMPIVDEDGNFEYKWYTNSDVLINDTTEYKKIKFIDVLKCGIQVFWIDNMETLKQIDEEINSSKVKDGVQKLDYLINQTNWKSDKVIYMNKYKDICPAEVSDDKVKILEYKHKKNKD